jgi:hypothetical protein
LVSSLFESPEKFLWNSVPVVSVWWRFIPPFDLRFVTDSYAKLFWFSDSVATKC